MWPYGWWRVLKPPPPQAGLWSRPTYRFGRSDQGVNIHIELNTLV